MTPPDPLTARAAADGAGPAAGAGPADRPGSPGREAPWLDLLTVLTAGCPGWLSWKGYESAISGSGDVDSVAPGEAWPEVTRSFIAWAGRWGLGPVVICPHAPGILHMVALVHDEDLYYELDVNRHKVFLGSTLFLPPDLMPMAYDDERGIRRLRPGAEGVLKLIQNGMRRGARVRWDQIDAKGIQRSLQQDPDGIRAVAQLFGRASGAITRGAEAVVRGDWDRRAMLTVEARSLGRAVTEPRAVAWRLRVRWHRRRCPVLRSVFDGGRRVPVEGRERWLDEVAAYGGHRVVHPDREP